MTKEAIPALTGVARILRILHSLGRLYLWRGQRVEKNKAPLALAFFAPRSVGEAFSILKYYGYFPARVKSDFW